jgi:uncharacterized protein
MQTSLKNRLFTIAEEKQTKEDPSHDFQHILRVTNLAQKIAIIEGADIDVVIPAALFHDCVVYPKNSPRSKNETEESAAYAEKILESFDEYPREKIEKVKICIEQCSFSKGIIPDLLEAKILQDADRLEATGAISIMRTFSSGGQMNRQFYLPEDPFYENTKLVPFSSNLELFYKRLLVVEKGMYTELAKKIAKRRTKFLKDFLAEFRMELKESDIMPTDGDADDKQTPPPNSCKF